MLKYFATNRGMEDLGKALDKSKDRHRLSRGGYYFVDMEEYMKYYLGTTDSDQMPRSAIVLDSTEDVFADFLCKEGVTSVVVCVHGFNVDLHEACTVFRVLTDSMKHLPEISNRIVTTPTEISGKSNVAFIGFSWPSDGSVLSYWSDQREATGSMDAFASLLARLKATGKSVNLICHSMGNYVACHALAALVNATTTPTTVPSVLKVLQRGEKKGDETVDRCDWLIDNFVMIAPDVERRHVTKCIGDGVESEYVGKFYSGLQHLARRKINIYSRQDSILDLSRTEKEAREVGRGVVDLLTFGLLDHLRRNPDQRWELRLGSAPAPVNASPGFASVNATEIAGRQIGHNDHFDSQEIALKIAHELEV